MARLEPSVSTGRPRAWPAPSPVVGTPGAGPLLAGRGSHRSGPAPRFGPVGQAVVHHAARPVTVVPHE